MSSLSLRARSVAAAALAIVLALLTVGVAVDLLASRHLHRSLDATLRQRAVDVAQLSASAPALLTAPGALDAPLAGTQQLVEVVDRRGRLVGRSLSLGGRVVPARGVIARTIATGRGGYANAELGEDSVRLYAAPLADVGGPAAGGAVVVAAPTSEIHSTLASLRAFILLASLAAAALAAGALALLMRRALRPLGRLADAAGEIERTGDPHRRLPEPRTADEIGRLSRTLNAMLASLERSRAAEGRFLADASHELRTPLTALRGNLDYLARHGASPELLDDLQQDAARLALLADDLLALSREEAAARPREPVRLDELAREACDDRTDVDAEPVEVLGDRPALERAVGNLVENAHLHGPEGGRIEITVARENGLARLSVRDEGPGLPAAEAEQAFRRFWRGGHGRPGSGLGLAIVRAIAERHGGRAYAEGARFTIELPALQVLSRSGGTTDA
jgi:signal transduction histidine kinase